MDALDAGDTLDAQHALMACLVRKPRRPGEIANRVDARLAGAHPLIDNDMAALDADPRSLKAEILRVADDSDRKDDLFDNRLPRRVEPGGDAPVPLLERADGRSGPHGHALFPERLAREIGDFGVLRGQDAVEHFHDRRFRAHVAVETGEFDADGARADHQHRFGDAFGDHRLAISPYAFAVGFDSGQRPRARAGRENYIGGLKARGFRAVLADRDGALAGERAVAVHDRYAVLAH